MHFINMNDFGTLIKFGDHKHLFPLQKEGLLYLNTLPYFWEIEDQELRGDPFDSVAEVHRGRKVVFPLPNGKEVSMEGSWVLKMPLPGSERINIFCMYALRPLAGTFPVDEKNFRFGNFALVLLNRPKFMRRLESTLKSQRIEAQADLIDYVDDDYTGKVGPFKKLKRFSYQSEWRLVCAGGQGEPRIIRIGSIEDISVLIRSEEINTEMKVIFE
jgi:hypothetical protein